MLCSANLLVFCKCMLASGVEEGAHSVQGGGRGSKARGDRERLHGMPVWGSFLQELHISVLPLLAYSWPTALKIC